MLVLSTTDGKLNYPVLVLSIPVDSTLDYSVLVQYTVDRILNYSVLVLSTLDGKVNYPVLVLSIVVDGILNYSV